MTTHKRRQELIDLLQQQPGLRVPELARALSVSLGTVRNDLNALEAEGKLMRVHGGAVLPAAGPLPVGVGSGAFERRYLENVPAKRAIARAAAALVQDGDSLWLDASTSACYLAQALAARQRLRVVTNGLETARLLAQNPTNTVILIGGVVNPDTSSVTGLLSEQIIKELHIQKAFVSCSGFNLERGLTEVHLAEAQLKRKVIESSQAVFALVDASKLGKVDLTFFAHPEQITRLLTDGRMTMNWGMRLQEAGIEFEVCDLEKSG